MATSSPSAAPRNAFVALCAVSPSAYERGLPTDYRADGGQRRDGLGGWIKARDGDYVDALRKGYGLTLLVTETTGAITPTFDALYRRYNKLSREPGTADYSHSIRRVALLPTRLLQTPPRCPALGGCCVRRRLFDP